MTAQYDDLIMEAHAKYLEGQFDWRLLKAQLRAESAFNPNAISPARAKGIAQFMQPTWNQVRREMRLPIYASPFNPDFAIPAAAYYMSKLLSVWSSPRPDIDRYCLAIASYNAGTGNLIRAQKKVGGALSYAQIITGLKDVTGDKNSAETTAYVKRILYYYTQMVTG